jgi:hypothetical protein
MGALAKAASEMLRAADQRCDAAEHDHAERHRKNGLPSCKGSSKGGG